MEDLFNKFFNTGLGALLITRDKLKDWVNDLVKRGRLSEEEGRQFLQDWKDEGEKRRQLMEDEFRDFLKKQLYKMNIPTRDEIDALHKRITFLEEQLEKRSQ
jgi:polyhydroxyalkanoate synthesis regulator phasin